MKTAATALAALLATSFAHPSFAQQNQNQYEQSAPNQYDGGMQGQDRNWRQDRGWRDNDERSDQDWHGPGHWGMSGRMGRIWEHHNFMHQNEAARFRLRHGNALIDVRCPENETIQVCVNAVSQLLDKVAHLPNVSSGGGSSPGEATPTPAPSVTAPSTTTPTR